MLGHGERVDNFTGINLPLTGTVACSEAFSPSIVHLMNVSSFNSNLCIHTKKSFFIVLIKQVEFHLFRLSFST